MNNFEAVLLSSPEITSKIKNDCLKKFTDMISENSGKIINAEDWGLRDLSYKMNNISKAFYNYYQFEIDGTKIENIKKTLSQDENFIRHLIIRVENHQELPTKLYNEKK